MRRVEHCACVCSNKSTPWLVPSQLQAELSRRPMPWATHFSRGILPRLKMFHPTTTWHRIHFIHRQLTLFQLTCSCICGNAVGSSMQPDTRPTDNPSSWYSQPQTLGRWTSECGGATTPIVSARSALTHSAWMSTIFHKIELSKIGTNFDFDCPHSYTKCSRQ